MSKSFLWVIMLTALVVPRDLFAEPRRSLRMEYSLGVDPKDCPDEGAVRNAIAAAMTYDPFQAGAADRLVITIANGPQGQVKGRAELYEGGAGRRLLVELPPHDCDWIIGALALAVADALEPWPADAAPAGSGQTAVARAGSGKAAASAGQSPMEPANAVHAPRAPGTAVIAKSPPSLPPKGNGMALAASSSVPPPERSFRWAVGVGGAAAMGTVPGGVSGQFLAKVGLVWHRAAVWAEGQVQPPAGVDVPGARMAGARYSGGITACARVLVFNGCGVVQAGAWVGEVDAPVPDAGPVPSFSAGGRLAVEVPLSRRLAAAAFGELLGVPLRPALRLDDARRWVGPSLAGAVGAEAVAFF